MVKLQLATSMFLFHWYTLACNNGVHLQNKGVEYMDFNPYKTIGHDRGFHVVDDITFVDHSLFKLTAQSQLHSHIVS